MSDACKSCSSATSDGGCSSGGCAEGPEELKLKKALSRIKHKIVVMSGKGGVGKSTVATNIAAALSLAGKRVGLLDVDVHGPSIPRLLSLEGQQPHIGDHVIEPISWSRNLWVMSLGFMLPSKNDAVIWRGPVKMGLIKQFVQDVDWGDLDYLVVDCPPGTGDEPLTALQTLGQDTHAVIVTTPQGVAVDDVRRSVSFVRQLGNPMLGIVENMSGFACPDCGSIHDIFSSGGGERLAAEMGVKFLGRIPMDPEVARSGDEGFPLVKVDNEGATAKAMNTIIQPMLKLSDLQQKNADLPKFDELPGQNGKVRIAVPVQGERLCEQFAGCDRFAVIDVDRELKSVMSTTFETLPSGEQDMVATWCADQKVSLLIAGSLAAEARAQLASRGMAVITGASAEDPENLVNQYLAGTLATA